MINFLHKLEKISGDEGVENVVLDIIELLLYLYIKSVIIILLGEKILQVE